MYPSYGGYPTQPTDHHPPAQEKLGKRQMVLFHFLLVTLVGTQWGKLISIHSIPGSPDLLLYICSFDNFIANLDTIIIGGVIRSAEDSFVASGVGA